MKLWVDDVRPCPHFDWDIAKTASEAISILETGLVTHISLDHDLGDDNDGTGYTVACWIEQAASENKIRPINWSIHSANPVGVKRIFAAMQSADKFWKLNHSAE